MSPLVRRTLAPRGKTPILKTKAKHREKVSVTAALTISPHRHRLRLYWQTYPQSFVNAERAADFLRALMRHLHGAVIVVWDGGPMHKGKPIQQVLHEFPRLLLERLPPYAPELNPVEYIWAYWKQHELPNVCPKDYWQLGQAARQTLRRMRRRPQLIAAFWKQASLWPE